MLHPVVSRRSWSICQRPRALQEPLYRLRMQCLLSQHPRVLQFIHWTKLYKMKKKNRTRTSCKEFIRCVFQIFSLVVWYIYFSITRCLLFFFSKRLLASKNYFFTLFLTVMQRNFLPVSSVWCFLLFFGCRFFYT